MIIFNHNRKLSILFFLLGIIIISLVACNESSTSETVATVTQDEISNVDDPQQVIRSTEIENTSTTSTPSTPITPTFVASSSTPHTTGYPVGNATMPALPTQNTVPLTPTIISDGAYPPPSMQAEESAPSIAVLPNDNEVSVFLPIILSPNVYKGFVVQTFSENTASKILPEGIKEQLAVFSGGGGGGPPPTCIYDEYPQVHSQYQERNPYGDKGLWSTIYVETCGWQYEELITITLTKPDGIIETTTVEADETNWGVDYQYTPDINSPVGTYELEFTGTSSTVSTSFSFTWPNRPTVYVSPETNLVFLHAFRPNEKIRLITYEPIEEGSFDGSGPSHAFSGSQDYNANDDGRLLLDLSNVQIWAIVAEHSGYFSSNNNNIDVRR